MKTNPSVPSLIQRTRGYPITALGDSFPVGNLGRGSTAGDTQASQCFTRLIAHPRSAESVAFPAFSIEGKKKVDQVTAEQPTKRMYPRVLA